METVKAARIGRALAEADLIVIGASNGFDMAEGLNLFRADNHFWEAYGDLAQTDGIGCILQGLASPDVSVRRQWAERFHQKEYLEYESSPLMNGLRCLTEHADTFVITCNIDGHFARAGFSENRVLETEGSICTSIDEMRLAHPDALATAQLEELTRLVQAHHNGRVVILELGVGLRNGIIKHMLAQVANARLVGEMSSLGWLAHELTNKLELRHWLNRFARSINLFSKRRIGRRWMRDKKYVPPVVQARRA